MDNVVDRLANKSPPWAPYRAFMSGRLIALAKHPRVRPVRVGETWKRLFAKIVLKVTGPTSNMAFQDDHMCARLEVGIDGTVHGVQAIRDKNSTTED